MTTLAAIWTHESGRGGGVNVLGTARHRQEPGGSGGRGGAASRGIQILGLLRIPCPRYFVRAWWRGCCGPHRVRKSTARSRAKSEHVPDADPEDLALLDDCWASRPRRGTLPQATRTRGVAG